MGNLTTKQFKLHIAKSFVNDIKVYLIRKNNQSNWKAWDITCASITLLWLTTLHVIIHNGVKVSRERRTWILKKWNANSYWFSSHCPIANFIYLLRKHVWKLSWTTYITICGLIDICPEMVKTWILGFEIFFGPEL